MRKQTIRLAIVVVALTASGFAQQSPSPQPTQAQAQALPCVTTPTSPNPSGSNTHIKVPNALQRALSKELQKVQAQTRVDVGGIAVDVAHDATAKPAPCPPQSGTAKTAQPVAPQVLKLPQDITATLHCNPMTPAPSASGRPTTLTLPDPHDFALPNPTDFEVDNVVPDLAAKTPCYLVKVDPKTTKSFVAQ